MNKKQVHIWSVYILVAIILGQFFSIVYISYFKTDFGYRVMSKCGLFKYEQDISRHKIEYRCLEGWMNCLEKLHFQADAVFYGNSITFESDFQSYFRNKLVLNLGCNRDDLDDLINRSFIIKSVRPKKIFVLGGINRLMDISLRDFESKYQVMVDTIINQNPSAKIYLQSILPVNPQMELGARYIECLDKIKDVNAVIRTIAINRRCNYIDLYSVYQTNDSLPRIYTRDGIHLKPEAYKIWAKAINQYIE